MNKKSQPIQWVQLVKRQASLAFIYETAHQNPHLQKVIDYKLQHYWYNGITFEVMYAQSEMQDMGLILANKVKKQPDFATQNAKIGITTCRRLINQSKQFSKLDFQPQNRQQLQNHFLPLYKTYQELIAYILPPHVIERNVSKEIKNFIDSKTKDPIKRQEYFTLLSQPQDEDLKQIKESLKLAEYVRVNGWSNSALARLNRYADSYRWLSMWDVTDKPLPNSSFKAEINTILQNFPKPHAKWQQIKLASNKRQKDLSVLLNKLKPPPQIVSLIHMMQAYVFLRTYRKNAFCQAHFAQLSFLDTVAQRMGISKREIKHLTYPEIIEYLKSGTIPNPSHIKQRLEGWAILLHHDKVHLFSGQEQVNQAIANYHIEIPKVKSTEISGRVACQGHVTGTVKIVTGIKELNKVKPGDILVAHMTTPDYLPAMYKAGAIVTDEGGVTCHAAIVSREFNIPCIVGTQNATSILKDGDQVTVDAMNGKVMVTT